MAGAIVNPRMLNISKPNARLRTRQRIIRARMGYVTPPPTVPVPAPAEPAVSAEPETPDQEAPVEGELPQTEPPPADPDSPSAPSTPDAPAGPATPK
jgi:hypothetical protein